MLTTVSGEDGTEHAVLSDGLRRIRIDILTGGLAGHDAVQLRFAFEDISAAQAGLRSLENLLGLIRNGRFAPGFHRRETLIARALTILRVHDALSAGASQREIAMALFGAGRVESDWNTTSDSLRSRIRRLVRDARAMAGGGYRALLRERR